MVGLLFQSNSLACNHLYRMYIYLKVYYCSIFGTWLLTLGVAGSVDTFNSLLPTYNAQSTATGVNLASRLEFYLNNEGQRKALAKQLQAEVLAKHTYRVRANEFVGIMNSLIGSSLDDNSMKVEFFGDNPEAFVRQAIENVDFQNYLAVQSVPRENDMSQKLPAICLGVRTHPGMSLDTSVFPIRLIIIFLL
jgi:hypothetical protein